MAEQGQSYWFETARLPEFPPLDADLSVDVVVVGAGITGLTTAYLLKSAGRSVAVIERGRVGGVDTMRTTAHATAVTDVTLTDLVSSFGRDHAQAAWDAGFAAIQQIESIVGSERISCDWARLTGYKHLAADSSASDRQKQLDELRREAALARELGFDAKDVDAVPVMGAPGIGFAHQGRFHPGQYLSHLAGIVNGGGSFIFERTSCDEIGDSPLTVKAGDFTVRCGYVVLATHNPLVGKASLAAATLLQTKLYLYTSYVVAGRLPRGKEPEALFWDTGDPYCYARVDRHDDHDFLIFGGEDHKTGQVADTDECFRRVEAAARRAFPAIAITHRWSGQVIETNDGLPFIGETSDKQFTATGFSGNGTTFGTLAAMMARDAVLGLKNPWRELFDPGRTKVKGGAWDYVKENLDYPYYMVRARFAGAEGNSLQALRPGEGKILSLDGKKVAAVRRNDGSVSLLSPVCPHMGCHVGWNDAESTWDCPCHGSRFTADGEVLSGPAESPLQPVETTSLP
jgi:glycine/D-amino acid oxidase-like deaminating enzyme/nitrite reductase/ring-hydroxylating ferredoxin subunit